jgi:hypothetical protein
MLSLMAFIRALAVIFGIGHVLGYLQFARYHHLWQTGESFPKRTCPDE